MSDRSQVPAALPRGLWARGRQALADVRRRPLDRIGVQRVHAENEPEKPPLGVLPRRVPFTARHFGVRPGDLQDKNDKHVWLASGNWDPLGVAVLWELSKSETGVVPGVDQTAS